MYKFKLQNEGFDVDVAHTGPTGLKLLKEKKPDLVLLDLRLPHMNGDEILEEIRSNDWGKDMKVVIAANINRAFAPWRLHLFDFDKYLVKAHHTPSEIHEIIEDILCDENSQTDRSSNSTFEFDAVN